MRTLALLVVWMSFSAPAAAEVINSTAANLLSRWWNPAHTFSSNSANLSLDARPGGCLCESVANGGVVHLTVVYVVAQKEIRFSGGLGPLQQTGVAGSMIWRLTEAAGGTQFEWTYTVDAVLPDQLNRLKRFVETGRPE